MPRTPGRGPALFLQTAHLFLEPSFLDVVRDLPGWAATFTQGFTSAMVVFALPHSPVRWTAFVGLRRLLPGMPPDHASRRRRRPDARPKPRASSPQGR
ncbi:MAG: hypothetical protein U0667_18800 [Chloroflexota bacterium]